MILEIIWLLVFATVLCFPIIFWKAYKKDEEVSQRISQLRSKFSDYQQQVNEEIEQYRKSYDKLANAYQDYQNKVKDLLSSQQLVIVKQAFSTGDFNTEAVEQSITTIPENSNSNRK